MVQLKDNTILFKHILFCANIWFWIFEYLFTFEDIRIAEQLTTRQNLFHPCSAKLSPPSTEVLISRTCQLDSTCEAAWEIEDTHRAILGEFEIDVRLPFLKDFLGLWINPLFIYMHIFRTIFHFRKVCF